MRSRFSHAKRASVLAVLSLIAACAKGDKPADGAATPAGKTFTIAMIAKSSTNPVFLSGRQGAQAAAAELTKTQGVTVKIDWMTSRNARARCSRSCRS